ncbi:MAG TPA: hypothetical protein VFF81_04925 [Noviherbaspirillum sp.]|nr:hypothetical protein [Noviherbaspirillum sp.]
MSAHTDTAGNKMLATVAVRMKQSVWICNVVACYGDDGLIAFLKGASTVAEVSATEAGNRARRLAQIQ